MPIYEFLCEACGPFEERLSFSESAHSAPCPSCHQASRRVYSMPGVSSASQAEKEARALGETGAGPQVVKRPGKETASSKRPARVGGRPWQIGH